MKAQISDPPGRTGQWEPCARPILPGQLCLLLTTLACFILAESYSQTGKPSHDPALNGKRSLAFDEDEGFADTWAAERKLILLFKAEGFLLVGQPHTNGVENALFKPGVLSTNATKVTVRWDPGEKGLVHYAYVRGIYPQLANYTLWAPHASAGCAVLISVPGKISADRAAAVKAALQEFDSTKKPVVKVSGDFTKRGDFRITVDQDKVEIENLWKTKGV